MSNTFIIENSTSIMPIKLFDLICITAEDYLVTFYLDGTFFHSTSQYLKDVESQLPDAFIKINRHCIVNINKIKIIEKSNRKVILANGQEFIISVRRMKMLRSALKSI